MGVRVYTVSIDNGPTWYFMDLKKAEAALRREGFVERAPIDFQNEAMGAWRRDVTMFSDWSYQYAYIGWITTQDDLATSPDLLAICKRILEVVKSGDNFSNEAFYGTDHAQLLSAIAKAEGGS